MQNYVTFCLLFWVAFSTGCTEKDFPVRKIGTIHRNWFDLLNSSEHFRQSCWGLSYCKRLINSHLPPLYTLHPAEALLLMLHSNIKLKKHYETGKLSRNKIAFFFLPSYRGKWKVKSIWQWEIGFKAKIEPHILSDNQVFFLVRGFHKSYNPFWWGCITFDLNPHSKTTSATKLCCKCL